MWRTLLGPLHYLYPSLFLNFTILDICYSVFDFQSPPGHRYYTSDCHLHTYPVLLLEIALHIYQSYMAESLWSFMFYFLYFLASVHLLHHLHVVVFPYGILMACFDMLFSLSSIILYVLLQIYGVLFNFFDTYLLCPMLSLYLYPDSIYCKQIKLRTNWNFIFNLPSFLKA